MTNTEMKLWNKLLRDNHLEDPNGDIFSSLHRMFLLVCIIREAIKKQNSRTWIHTDKAIQIEFNIADDLGIPLWLQNRVLCGKQYYFSHRILNLNEQR